MPTDELIGKRIQDIRIQRHMTQETLASRIGISKSSISEWEACKRVPRMETLRKIADALGVDVWEIIGFEEVDYTPPVNNEVDELVGKWNALDNYGKRAVKAVMDVEYERMQAECSQENQND
jgi:transcriptional regulator with XRE-family HTH domain